MRENSANAQKYKTNKMASKNTKQTGSKNKNKNKMACANKCINQVAAAVKRSKMFFFEARMVSLPKSATKVWLPESS